jgi:YggT family protein
MRNSLIFLIRTLGDLYVMVFLLRFLLQWVRADFYNPLAQFVVKATNPLVVPARRVIPSLRGTDLPTLVLLLILEGLLTWAILALIGVTAPVLTVGALVILRLINTMLWLYVVSIFVYVILSWVSPAGYSPIGRILADLNEPLLRPVRRILPPIGGLDLAPMLVVILIAAIRIALPLPVYLR